MAEKATAKEALEKLKNKLECTICLTDYTDPKLLPCFHVFCKKCLEPLVIQDHDGLSLQCPICRHSTKLPPKGVAALQSDFHVEHMFEIRDAFEKAKQPQKTRCEKCEDDNTTGFCRDCGEFICDACTTVHRKWKQFKSHEIISLEEVQTEATNLVRPKKQVSYCPRHPESILKIFCETCSELICIDCTIGLHPRPEHCYNLVSDIFPKHKEEIVASLQPVKQQLSTVTKALHTFEERVREIEEQKTITEAAVHKEINLLQQLLEQRRAELISKLDHLTQLKLKTLTTQRDQVELVQVKLSSCLDYVDGGLKTGTEGEVLAMKTPVLKRIKQITADFKPATLQPEEEADLELIANNKQDLQQACKEFGDIKIPEVSPENSYTRGEGLVLATVGEQAVAMVTTMSVTNREYIHQTNLTAELVHCKSKDTLHTDIQMQQNSQYKITYQPTKRGKHQLNIKINGREIQGSPFIIAVTSSPQSLERPVRVIGNLKTPCFVTTNSQNQIIVTEAGSNCVSVFSPEGEKIHSFGSEGTNDGQFQFPSGVTVDNVGNIYVVDNNNHRIHKFSSDGKFIQSVGTLGSGQLQFKYPMGVSFNPNNQKLYVCDQLNHRVQFVNTDLTFHSTIGRKRTGNGEFKATKDIAFNSNGDIYITDCYNHRVQIFNQDEIFLRTLRNKQQGQTLQYPVGIAVDSSDTVYVSERHRDCISVFTAEGEYLTTFGGKGKTEGQFDWPHGLHIDKNDSLLVCDMHNGRIQIF